MQGLGNDFVVVEAESVAAETVRAMCDRRFGIGADGVLAVDDQPTMRYWNADGTPAEMCGNGLRCVARYAVERLWSPANEWFTVSTPVGDRRARVEELVTVEIGPVEIGPDITIDGLVFTRASVGNPHAVHLTDDLEAVDVMSVGGRVGTDPLFPKGTNVEFVTVRTPDVIDMRVWERGVGETLACGSGIVVAAAVVGDTDGPVVVHVPGGVARVDVEGGSSYLTGPAESVFSGEWPD